MDNLKEELNIKKSFNNPEIFVEFDSFYKQLGNLQNAKMKENILNFNSLNKSISTLVNGLVNRNISIINEALSNCLNMNQYNDILNQIHQKSIKPNDGNEIINELIENRKKRTSSITNFSNDLGEIYQDKINNVQENNNNSFNSSSYFDSFKNTIMLNSDSNQDKNNGENNSIQKKIISFSLNSSPKFAVNKNNNNLEKEILLDNHENILFKSRNTINNINSNLYSNYRTIKIDGDNPGDIGKKENQIIYTNKIQKRNIYSSNLFQSATNKENIAFDKINSSSNFLNNNHNSYYTDFLKFNRINNNNNNITNNQMISNLINPEQEIFKKIETTIISDKLPVNGSPKEMVESKDENFILFNESILNAEYILFPIPQTNCIKIITHDNEDKKVQLKFPKNIGFNSFLYDCAHCNCLINKCLYVSGGVELFIENKISNKVLCIDMAKPDEYKVTKRASMKYARWAHTMVSDNKYILFYHLIIIRTIND